MARPTKYCKEMLVKARAYLDNYKEEGDVIPQIAGLACYLPLSRDTIYQWAKDEDKAEFSDIVGEILSSQERVLINKGLEGDFNASLAKLALAKHGYADSQNVAHNVEGVSFNLDFGANVKKD